MRKRLDKRASVTIVFPDGLRATWEFECPVPISHAAELRGIMDAALDKLLPLPDWEDLRGRAPDATGELSSEAFVRELRDG